MVDQRDKPILTPIQKAGLLKALWRFVADRDVNLLWRTIKTLFPPAYVVFPADVLPDVVPVIGWLDDIGVVLTAAVIAHNVIKKYRISAHPRRKQVLGFP